MRNWIGPWLGVALAAAALPTPALAGCQSLFLRDTAPTLQSEAMAARTTALCNESYAVMASGVTKGTLWSAEHLTRESVLAARRIPRNGLFHAETRMPWTDQAQLRDYKGSGWDRGHMAPSGDAATPDAQSETFSLANMVPQSPQLNRGRWERIEDTVRNLAVKDDDIYVVTGPAFEGTKLAYVGIGRVLVPQITWKAIADVARHETGAWICTNDDQAVCKVVPVSEVIARAHIDPFPAIPASDKDHAMALPLPDEGRYRGNWEEDKNGSR